MTGNLNAVLITALLVIPGVWFYLTSKASRTWDDDGDELPDAIVLVVSLGLTSLLLSVEVIGGGVAAAISETASDRAAALFRDGIRDYGSEHAADVLIGVPALFLFNSAALALLGLLDPLGKLQEARMRPHGIMKESAWYGTFRPDVVRSQSPESPNFVQVFLNDEQGTRYVGALGNFDIRSDRHGERNIQLWNARRKTNDGWPPVALNEGELSSVLVKCSLIKAIEVTYSGVADAQTRSDAPGNG